MGAVPDQYTNGTASFFSNRQPAWHNFGVVTEGALTAEQALQTAQLLSPVTKVPVFAFVNDEYVEIEDKWATGSPNPVSGVWRTHGVVGNNYEIVQNAEQFAVLDAIRDESGAAYETAGAMHNGKVVFVTMKMPDSLVFNAAQGSDQVDLYLMAMNSHDGSKAFTLAVTPIRVVCQNTLDLAVRQAHRVFKIKHTRNAKSKITEAREALDLTFAYVEEFEQQVQQLIAQPMSDGDFERFIDSLVKKPAASKRQETRIENTKIALRDMWNSPTQQLAGKNKWGAWNAVTEWVDWESGVRLKKANSNSEARAMRTMSAAASQTKQKAFALLNK